MATAVQQRRNAAPGLVPSARVGGIGGLLFVGTVVVQNLLRMTLPANDAAAARVIRYYADHRSTTVVLAALFAVGAVGVTLFTGALRAAVRRADARGAATAGTLAVAGVIALFSLTVVADLALSAYVHRGHPDPQVAIGLWTLHGAAFGVLEIFIGIALAGLAAAASAEGLVAVAWRGVGLVGGLLLVVGGALTPAALDGSPVIAVALVGFVVWLVFVAAGSIAMLRRPQPSENS